MRNAMYVRKQIKKFRSKEGFAFGKSSKLQRMLPQKIRLHVGYC